MGDLVLVPQCMCEKQINFTADVAGGTLYQDRKQCVRSV